MVVFAGLHSSLGIVGQRSITKSGLTIGNS